MHERFLARVADWARARDDVRAVVLIGSQARASAPADEWSDVDLLLLVADPAPYVAGSDWVAAFGEPLLTIVEPTAVGGELERRVLYRDGLQVDFALMPAGALPALMASREAASVPARGHRVLLDREGVEAALTRLPAPQPRRPGAAELEAAGAEFWYFAVLAARKLARGEVWVAKQLCDGLLKAQVVQLLAWRAAAGDPALDTWHRGRFLERWADAPTLAELASAYASYDAADVARALARTVELFARVEADCARLLTPGAAPER